MKAVCKSLGCSMNDYLATLLGVTLHEYMQEFPRKDPKGELYEIPDSVKIQIPFSFRKPQTKLQNFRLENDFAGLATELKVSDNFDETLKYQKKEFDYLKSSIYSYSSLYAGKVTLNLPYTLPCLAVRLFGINFSFTFSNVNASKVTYSWDGKQLVDQFFFAPGSWDGHTIISVSTVGKLMTISVSSEETQLQYPAEFLKIFSKKNLEIIS